MSWRAITYDWSQVRAFLATAEEGSLSAAARALGQTQPTLSRQVTALETQLGVTLFERGPRTMILTESGREMLVHARAMRDSAMKLSFIASGQSEEISGEVSITSTDLFAVHTMPPILRTLREAHPSLRIHVLTSNQLQDLTRRDADIAIRHTRPEQTELIGKQVGTIDAYLYAHKSYLDRKGRPETPADLAELDFIGFEAASVVLPVLSSMGLPVSEANLPITTTSGPLYLELVKSGLGISILTRDAVKAVEGMEKVFSDAEPIEVPVWLVTHRELRTSRKIRVVFDAIAEGLRSEL